MALYYHLGSSGAGKTSGIQKKIIEQAEKELDKSFLFIVPEQFTLQTQREILLKSRANGMYNIDALSFNRLCYRVFDELGLTLPSVLEDTGKSMIVKKVVLEHKDELTVYKSKVKKQGFIDEMKSLIAEFYQYGIDKDTIGKMKEVAGDRRILKAKLDDIGIIYEAFAKFIDGRFVMNEEVIDRMCDIAAGSKLLKNATVVLDGFTGFTPSQYNCIDCMMKYCADIHVVITIGNKEAERVKNGDLRSEGSLFELSIKTIRKLEELAVSKGIDTGIFIYDGKNGRYKDNPSLTHLERNIFRFPYDTSDDHSAVKLLSASDTDEETDFIVSKIRELVTEKGMRYENIAVLTGDLSAYGNILARKFMNAGIPVFIDEKHSIAGMNAVEFIDSVIDVQLTGYSYESVFRFLKTGLTGLDPDSIARTENYVLSCGIKGLGRWNGVWKKKAAELDTINDVREKTAKLLRIFGDNEKNRPTVTERLKALYEILDVCEVELKLYERAELLKNSEDPGDRIKGVGIGQLFRMIVTVFERINSLLGNERMELKEFRDVLSTGFNEAKLKSIPGGADSVVAGDIERTRIDNKKVIFFAGCNDGVIPKTGSGEGILNEFDRELLADSEIELSPTKRENMALNEFYLYLALTKPSERLYITYSRKTDGDREAGPAYLFGRILKLYNGLKVERLSAFEKDSPFRLLGCDRGIGRLIKGLRLSGNTKDAVTQILKEEIAGENKALTELLERAASGKREHTALTGEEAEKLYGRVIIGSITRLQQFAKCAFSHFAEYGLGLKERKEYRIGSLELGSIYHSALQNYAAGLKKDRIKWTACLGQEREEREKKAIEEALAEYDEILSSTRRLSYLKNSIARVISRTVDVVTGQISLGEFDVGYVEKAFSHESTLMKLTGKIDRLDTVKKNGKTYIRVIDYKTGKTDFDMTLVKAGLQLQLAIYTFEAAAMLREQGETARAAGMYYYYIDDPIFPADKADGKNMDDKRAKQLRLEGLTVNEDEIIGLHDSSLINEDGSRASTQSNVIKYEFTKDGHIGKKCEKSLISGEDFDAVAAGASNKAKELAKEILSGKTDADPYEYKKNTPCKYCEYKDVCGFDRRRGDTYRKITEG